MHREHWTAAICGNKGSGASGQSGAASMPSYQGRSTQSIVSFGVLGGPLWPLVHQMAVNVDWTDSTAAGGWEKVHPD